MNPEEIGVFFPTMPHQNRCETCKVPHHTLFGYNFNRRDIFICNGEEMPDGTQAFTECRGCVSYNFGKNEPDRLQDVISELENIQSKGFTTIGIDGIIKRLKGEWSDL